MLTAIKASERTGENSDLELPVWDITDVESWMTIKATL